MRRLRAAQSEHEAATLALEGLKVRLGELAVEQSKAAAAERTLRDSPEMKDARALEESRLAAESARKTADSARQERDRSASALAREQHQRQVAAEKTAAGLRRRSEASVNARGRRRKRRVRRQKHQAVLGADRSARD